MTALHLPVAHTEDDLALAGALAQVLGSAELYVAWSTDGGAARPLVDAMLELERAAPDRLRRPRCRAPARRWSSGCSNAGVARQPTPPGALERIHSRSSVSPTRA